MVDDYHDSDCCLMLSEMIQSVFKLKFNVCLDIKLFSQTSVYCVIYDDLYDSCLTLLHLEWPKLYGVLAILSAVGYLYVEILNTMYKLVFNVCFNDEQLN